MLSNCKALKSHAIHEKKNAFHVEKQSLSFQNVLLKLEQHMKWKINGARECNLSAVKNAYPGFQVKCLNWPH